MKKATKLILGVLAIGFVWWGLKYLGVIGRQFAAGTNTQKQFELTQIGEEFELSLNKDKRGIYRYSGRLVFGETDYVPTNTYQNATFSFTEVFCDSGRLLGSSYLKIKAEPNIASHSGIGRYGALVKTPIFRKRGQVCLKIKVEDLSKPIAEDLKLNVWAGNTRPCWGIECMLD